MKTKFYFLLLGLMMAMTFTSCSDDDDTLSLESQLIGGWQSTWYSGWAKTNGVQDYDWDEEFKWTRFYFYADGTGKTVDLTASWELEYSWETTMEFTWTLNGNVLVLNAVDSPNYTDYTETYTIEIPDANTLITTLDGEEEFFGDMCTSHNVMKYKRIVE
jgi:hypothetical protein